MKLPVAKLNDLSLRRTQLMGVATLMVLVCHASALHVLMPHWLGKLMDLGNYGVDIFLMLSGIGLYYSLSNKPVTTVLGGGKLLQAKRFPYSDSILDSICALLHYILFAWRIYIRRESSVSKHIGVLVVSQGCMVCVADTYPISFGSNPVPIGVRQIQMGMDYLAYCRDYDFV